MPSIPGTASAFDLWEFDRQQNIIDTIDGLPAGTTEAETYSLTKRRAEALAIQFYLEQKYSTDATIESTVDAADANWVAMNPAPT